MLSNYIQPLKPTCQTVRSISVVYQTLIVTEKAVQILNIFKMVYDILIVLKLPKKCNWKKQSPIFLKEKSFCPKKVLLFENWSQFFVLRKVKLLVFLFVASPLLYLFSKNEFLNMQRAFLEVFSCFPIIFQEINWLRKVCKCNWGSKNRTFN